MSNLCCSVHLWCIQLDLSLCLTLHTVQAQSAVMKGKDVDDDGVAKSGDTVSCELGVVNTNTTASEATTKG